MYYNPCPLTALPEIGIDDKEIDLKEKNLKVKGVQSNEEQKEVLYKNTVLVIIKCLFIIGLAIIVYLYK